MAAPRTRFERDTAVEPGGDGRFSASLDPGWWIVQGPNGGYVAAVVLRAILARVDDPARHPRSLTVHYLAGADAGPIVIDTTIERAGRSVTSCSARAAQGDRLVALALAAVATSRPGPELNDLPIPAAPPPTSLPRADPPPYVPAVAHRWDHRWVVGSPPDPDGPPAAEAHHTGWLRLDEPQPMDAPAIAAAADGTMPAVFTRLGAPLVAVPTIDLTVHFRAPLPHPGLAPDGFVLADFRTQVIADGFLEEDSVIWAPDGTLLAQSRQLALVLPVRG